MCGTNDLQLDSCYKQKHEDTSAPTHSCSSSRSNSNSEGNSSVEKVWKETHQLMEDCEQLVRIMTHVCSQQFSGAYRTSLARYSQGCWLGCSSEESGGECGRCCATASHHHNVNSSHSTSSSWRHPSCSPPSSPSQMLSGCKGGCHSCGGCGESCCSAAHNPRPCNNHHHQEETTTPSPPASSSCRWRGWRWRRRWGRCQSDQCHKGGCCCSCCCCCSSVTTTTPSTTTMGLNSGVCRLGPLPPSTTTSSSYSQLPSSSSTTTVDLSTSITTTTAYTSTNPCPTLRASEGCCPTTRDVAAHPTRVHTPRARLVTQGPSQARATPAATTTASPKPRGGSPAHPSLLTILLLLVVTLARFTDGCSSRSTPKPRPASPTMRPNITFQTYACPPAYAAWYCLNGATCFTVKIGESILYNCECADGYMGQRCEFKDLDGSYLPAREKVLLETASIAGGATVACVLVFMVLFAVYIFMQKDKDKRCRDLDEQHNDRQPFSGYQNPRPEMFRTISNPYARTFEELSHVEVESAGHDTASSGGRNGSGSTGGGNLLDSNLHSSQHSATPQPS